LITSEIGDVLTDEILFGQLKNGGEAMVDCQSDKLVFSYGK
jgi:ATP-dependent Clp protease ATP-binding subunit ClpA